MFQPYDETALLKALEKKCYLTGYSLLLFVIELGHCIHRHFINACLESVFQRRWNAKHTALHSGFSGAALKFSLQSYALYLQ